MTAGIDASFVPKLAKKARLKHDRHTNKTMILYPERGLELNGSAAAIAQKIDGARSIALIVDELVKEHEGAPREDIEKDVLAFVRSLGDKGLLER
jgi:coenzyme PQQ biosynthesis protein PqqD